jgi:nitroimidazol reductase NimA-like FMN-containing flavoprotein (pyridoxamine 5'-phosphate oxidase superfamily)
MTTRSTLRRHPERAVPDEALEILAAGLVAHVGFAVDQQPYVLPMTYQFEPEHPDRLFLHGAKGSRLIKRVASGTPVCVTVTLADGLVYSRSAMYHSMNYRSVVCFGRARPVEDDAAKRRVFEAMTARYFPGRTVGRDYAPASRGDLRGTGLLEVAIEELAAKARRGGAAGPFDADEGAPGSSGVVVL